MLAKEIIDTIHSGAQDNDLKIIERAIKSRQNTLLQNKLLTLKLGDSVRMCNQVNPAYLRGLSGKITSQMIKGNKKPKIQIKLDHATGGRFDQTFWCPIDLLEFIN